MSWSFEEILTSIKQHPKLVVAEDYELVIQSYEGHTKHFKDGLNTLDCVDERLNVNLRVLHRKCLGKASATSASPESLSRMVDRAFDSAEITTVDPWFRFPIWKKDRTESPTKEFGQETFPTDSLYSALISPPKGLEEQYEVGRTQTRISRKLEKQELKWKSVKQRTFFSVLNEVDGTEYRVCQNRAYSRPLIEREKVLTQLLRQSERYKKARKAEKILTGQCIFSASVVASLLSLVEPWFNAFRIIENKSPIKEVDVAMFSDAINLIDNGAYEGGELYSPFDLEGVTTQETRLVERGMVKNFLHQSLTALRFNRASTGNLNRLNPDDSIGIGATHFYIEPTQTTLMELMQLMQKGIYLEVLEDLKFNSRTGSMEILGHGWRVESSDPLEPLLFIRARVNLFEFWKRIEAVANDLEFFGCRGASSIFIKDLPLS